MKRLAFTIAGLGLALINSNPTFAASPQQVAKGFVDGVKVCLEASLNGTSVQALPADMQKRVSKADEGSRFMAGPRNVSGPIWNVTSAAGNVLISEAAAGDCEVITFGPPVKATLNQAMEAIKSRQPSFTATDDAPDDYTPIRYGLSDVASGVRVHVILQGAEPGTVPGRMFRFSTLSARFTRQDIPSSQ